jgi:D-sedoheptulose 7-phosphate isomerase
MPINDQYFLQADIAEVIAGLNELSENIVLVEKAAKLVSDSLLNGGIVFFCGNGGSAADSQHWAAELTGRFNYSRQAYRAIALTVDTSALTAIGNDFGFDKVFARQLEGLAREGDVLVGITTSGNSKNVVEAAKSMKSLGGNVIGFSGPAQGALDEYSDIVIRAQASRTDLIQNIQVVIGHSLCKITEQLLVEHGN